MTSFFGGTLLLSFICWMTRIRGNGVHHSSDLLIETKIYSLNEYLSYRLFNGHTVGCAVWFPAMVLLLLTAKTHKKKIIQSLGQRSTLIIPELYTLHPGSVQVTKSLQKFYVHNFGLFCCT